MLVYLSELPLVLHIDEVPLSLKDELIGVLVDQAPFVDAEVVADMPLPDLAEQQSGGVLLRLLPRHRSPPLVKAFSRLPLEHHKKRFAQDLPLLGLKELGRVVHFPAFAQRLHPPLFDYLFALDHSVLGPRDASEPEATAPEVKSSSHLLLVELDDETAELRVDANAVVAC